MPFRIKKGDLLIEADTEGELRSVLAALGAIADKVPKLAAALSQPEERVSADEALSPSKSVHEAAREPIVSRLLRLYHKLNGAPDAIVEHLVSEPDGLNDVQLRRLIEVDDNRKLAGVLAGITKQAAKCGFAPGEFIIKTPSDSADGAIYHYRLAPEVILVLQSKYATRKPADDENA